MGAIRWRDLLGPPSLLVSSALLITAIVPAAMAAGPLRPPPSPVTPCPTEGVAGGGEPAAIEESVAAAETEATVTAETLLTRLGEETGVRLSVDSVEAPPVQISLPPESFIAPPVGELLVYGSHSEASGSEVRAVSLSSGCDVRLVRPAEVVRSALLDPQGRYLYVHSVSQAERSDTGISRHDLSTGEVRQVVEPLPLSEHFGRTFATQLRWSLAGDELAVQSCGFELCRTRVLDVGSGRLTTYAGEGHGALVGLTDTSIFVFDVCHGAPCDVLAIDRAGRTTSLLVAQAFEANLEADDRGEPLLLVETAAGMREVRP